MPTRLALVAGAAAVAAAALLSCDLPPEEAGENETRTQGQTLQDCAAACGEEKPCDTGCSFNDGRGRVATTCQAWTHGSCKVGRCPPECPPRDPLNPPPGGGGGGDGDPTACWRQADQCRGAGNFDLVGQRQESRWKWKTKWGVPYYWRYDAVVDILVRGMNIPGNPRCSSVCGCETITRERCEGSVSDWGSDNQGCFAVTGPNRSSCP
jgi:hypothetical protein